MDTRILLLWIIVYLCLFVSSIHSKSFFIHSSVVNGKKKIVATEVNSTASSFGNTRPKTAAEPKSEKFEIPLSSVDQEWLGSLLYHPNESDIRLRKEYRQLSEKEREDLNVAFNLLKNDTSVSLNKYDLLANIHARSSANANAHQGPNFMGWHRVFLLMMENALRQKVKTVTIPYWDVTLDEAMDKPYSSIIWSPDFIGSGDGVIKKGAFGHWQTQFGYGYLMRFLSGQGKLMSKENIEDILSKSRLGEITNPAAEKKFNIEEIHNDVHVWIGGQMKTIEIAAFDPIFYPLHSFTDCIWTEFREQQKAKGIDPTSDYPEFYGGPTHSPFAPMSLGSVMVIDGISDIWNQYVYYTPRPSCNETYNGCDSSYIKCDISKRKCISKSRNEVELENQSLKMINDDKVPTDLVKSGFENNASLSKETDSEMLYISNRQLIKRSAIVNYRQFDKLSENSIAAQKVVRITTISDVYQFYSYLTDSHTDLINLLLFLIYLNQFHFKPEHY
ncbi:putative tyrosinase-like protein tyr-3 [Mytilus trossulus]|uniref:putative tyrosinase-like protein tyr-3 n=1 Tax=Mytilus trossulus TaxID=6551 RepID=UPI00300719AB